MITKLEVYAAMIVVALLLIAGTAGALKYWEGRAHKAEAGQQVAKDTDVVDKGQTALGHIALDITTKGQARDDAVTETERNNADALLTAGPPAAGVDPDIARTFVDGLRHYPSYGGPGGGGLPAGDPGQQAPARAGSPGADR